MPGQKRCEPGCECGHHNRPRKLDWSSREEKNAYLREYRAERREETRAKARDRYRSDPEAVRAANRANYARNAEKYRQQAREYRASLPPGTISARNRKSNYGVTPETIARFMEEQGGCCYLCNEPLVLEGKQGAAVDHDHSCCRGRRSCGRCIRGLACAQCNKGIGHFGDDPERMRRVADRLDAANKRLAAERAAAPVQQELPINVRRLERKEESA